MEGKIYDITEWVSCKVRFIENLHQSSKFKEGYVTFSIFERLTVNFYFITMQSTIYLIYF